MGWTILERQYHTPYGEIDIIATKEGCVWFVEVKGSTYSSISFERISRKKRLNMLLSAEHWLTEKNCAYEELELVVCLGTTEGLHWITNAFDGE